MEVDQRRGTQPNHAVRADNNPRAEQHAATIARLIAEGRMPTLEQLTQAMAEAREKFYDKKPDL